MSSRKKILIVCDSDLSRESRVIRKIIALKDEYDLYTIGVRPAEFAEVKHFALLPETSSNPKHWSYPYVIRKAVSFSLNLYQKFKSGYSSFYYEKEYWTARRKEIVERLK